MAKEGNVTIAFSRACRYSPNISRWKTARFEVMLQVADECVLHRSDTRTHARTHTNKHTHSRKREEIGRLASNVTHRGDVLLTHTRSRGYTTFSANLAHATGTGTRRTGDREWPDSRLRERTDGASRIHSATYIVFLIERFQQSFGEVGAISLHRGGTLRALAGRLG